MTIEKYLHPIIENANLDGQALGLLKVPDKVLLHVSAYVPNYIVP